MILLGKSGLFFVRTDVVVDLISRDDVRTRRITGLGRVNPFVL